ncbi:SDR family oxidoreductase [bacterium]|nr:MAG: SDR family oxidoreductase [bacterium]
MRIGITGSEGLIGWHLRSFLHGKEGVEVLPADRATFATGEALRAFVRRCDAIVHLAGRMRGDDDEVYNTNVSLVEQLIQACETEGVAPHVVFSSSTHVSRDTPYGRSKRVGAELFSRWAARSGGSFTNLILPNVFGEGGKPFYNSCISTFCFQLANAQKPTIIQDSTLELVHAQEVARRIHAILQDRTAPETIVPGVKMLVSELLSRLMSFESLYKDFIIPDLRERTNAFLFNTYRSYLFPSAYPMTPTLHSDPRGHLYEAVKTVNGGQAFFSTTHPGITRGNHYHLRKFERFCVVQGEAVIRVRKLFSPHVHEFHLSGDTPQFVDIPTLHAHEITNTGAGNLLTAFWTGELYDKADPDTFAEKVRL